MHTEAMGDGENGANAAPSRISGGAAREEMGRYRPHRAAARPPRDGEGWMVSADAGGFADALSRPFSNGRDGVGADPRQAMGARCDKAEGPCRYGRRAGLRVRLGIMAPRPLRVPQDRLRVPQGES